MTILTFASRWLGFSRADEITIVFCGSKKSLASGVSIATVLFVGHVGLAIIPLMLFHQIQLMVCASLARRYARRGNIAAHSRKRFPKSIALSRQEGS
jgi:solute carrier family 10 (sodium/bile acid cotransporter), member 7